MHLNTSNQIARRKAAISHSGIQIELCRCLYTHLRPSALVPLNVKAYVRLLLESEEDMISLLMLLESKLAQLPVGFHMNSDLLAVSAGVNVETTIACLYRERSTPAAHGVHLLPIVVRALSKHSGRRKKKNTRRDFSDESC